MSNSRANPSQSNIPFYTQSAVLANYAHLSNPASDPVALKVILDVLRQENELRRRFFDLRPNASWLDVLWEEGFFKGLPTTDTLADEKGYFRFWDVQQFLIANACERPNYVLQHLEHLDFIKAEPIFKEAGLRALIELVQQRQSHIDEALPLILHWYDDFNLAKQIAYVTFDLLKALCKSQNRAAFDLLGEIVKPHRSHNAQFISDSYWVNTEAKGVLDENDRYLLQDAEENRKLLTQLRQLDFESLRDVFESNLLEALAVEAKTCAYDDEKYDNSLGWRQAIEDTNQNYVSHHKDFLLVTLRDILEDQGKEDSESLEKHITRYLRHPKQVLRRLGLYLLRSFPQDFIPQVEGQLLEKSNYENSDIQHEFFELLAKGFPFLSADAQQKVLNIILGGPSNEYLDSMVEWGLSVRDSSPQEMRRLYLELWQHDRLFMIRSYLPEKEKSLLDDIIIRLGEPKYPSFSSQVMSGAVQSVSPLSRERLRELTPEQLLDFLHSWQPSSGFNEDFKDVNWEGLASEVAYTLCDDLPAYETILCRLFVLHPRLALAMINITFRVGNPDIPEDLSINSISPLQLWQWRLQLVEEILAHPDLRTDISPSFDAGWREVRLNLVNLLKKGLEINDERKIPDELLPSVGNALLTFAEDLDPDSENDKPKEGWAGHKDPLTVSINHVRTEALNALVTYSLTRSKRGLDGLPDTGIGPERLQPEIVTVLTAHLDRGHDSSWAVRSVYGRNLGNLYWIDKNWTEAHIESIFPWGTDDETRWYFAAAWDAYIVSHRQLVHDLFERMRHIYVCAIEAMETGFITQTHLQRTECFAAHLFCDFFSPSYDLRGTAGPNNLLRLFMGKATPEQRGQVAWTLWRIVVEEKTLEERKAEGQDASVGFSLKIVWEKAREFWQWRVDESFQQSNPSDFDDEMRWLCLLVNAAPENESLASLYSLLIATLPHLGGSNRRFHAWKDLESFVAVWVDRDPVTSIRFYSQMHIMMVRPHWHIEDTARIILETAAASNEAHGQALDLLDLLARRGIVAFDDIYKRWAKS